MPSLCLSRSVLQAYLFLRFWWFVSLPCLFATSPCVCVPPVVCLPLSSVSGSPPDLCPYVCPVSVSKNWTDQSAPSSPTSWFPPFFSVPSFSSKSLAVCFLSLPGHFLLLLHLFMCGAVCLTLVWSCLGMWRLTCENIAGTLSTCRCCECVGGCVWGCLAAVWWSCPILAPLPCAQRLPLLCHVHQVRSMDAYCCVAY